MAVRVYVRACSAAAARVTMGHRRQAYVCPCPMVRHIRTHVSAHVYYGWGAAHIVVFVQPLHTHTHTHTTKQHTWQQLGLSSLPDRKVDFLFANVESNPTTTNLDSNPAAATLFSRHVAFPWPLWKSFVFTLQTTSSPTRPLPPHRRHCGLGCHHARLQQVRERPVGPGTPTGSSGRQPRQWTTS